MLSEQMRNNLNEARKKRDKDGEIAFGNVVAKILIAEKSGKYSVPLSDEVVQDIIIKECKEIEESLSYYQGRPCKQATELTFQYDILKFYLPKEVTQDQVIEIIEKLAEKETNRGKLIGMVCKEVGNRFDRSKIAPLVNKLFGSK